MRPVPWPVIAAAAAVLGLTWLWVLLGPAPPWSDALAARAADRPLDAIEWLSLRLTAITHFPGNALAGAAIAAALLLARRLEALVFAIAALLATGAAAWLAKAVTRDPRPLEDPLGPASGYGFPSAHASSWASLVMVAWCVVPSGRARAVVLWAGIPLVLAIAASRVHLGAHAPIDVVGGAGLGVLVAGLASRLPLLGPLSPRGAPRPGSP